MQEMPTFAERGGMNTNTKTNHLYVSIAHGVEWCRS